MRYEYRIKVTRAAAGTVADPGVQDPETGAYDAPGTTPAQGRATVLDCPADVQDAGEAVPRNASGMPWLQSDATVFIPPSHHEELMELVPGDVATVYYPNSDRIAEGNVKMVRDLDDALLVVYR